MGMFDEVYIDTTMLPETEEIQEILSKANFQTKSLDNDLSEVFINSDGSLSRMMYHYEEQPESEIDKASEESYFSKPSFVGGIRRVDDGIEMLNYTGVIQFYAFAYDIWYEYEATFVDGKLQKIVKV